MVYHVLVLIPLLLFSNGCAAGLRRSVEGHAKPTAMTDIYARSIGDAKKDTARFIEQNLKEQKSYGYVKPYIPVVEGPVVRKVWVPDQRSSTDPAILVGGHWLYLMIQGPKWFTEASDRNTQIPVTIPAKPIHSTQ